MRARWGRARWPSWVCVGFGGGARASAPLACAAVWHAAARLAFVLAARGRLRRWVAADGWRLVGPAAEAGRSEWRWGRGVGRGFA